MTNVLRKCRPMMQKQTFLHDQFIVRKKFLPSLYGEKFFPFLTASLDFPWFMIVEKKLAFQKTSFSLFTFLPDVLQWHRKGKARQGKETFFKWHIKVSLNVWPLAGDTWAVVNETADGWFTSATCETQTSNRKIQDILMTCRKQKNTIPTSKSCKDQSV